MHHVVVEIGFGACEQAEPNEHRPDEGRDQRGDALGVRGDGDDDGDELSCQQELVKMMDKKQALPQGEAGKKCGLGQVPRLLTSFT